MEIKSIPIAVDGHLRYDAGMLVLGYMLYPHCERSAKQFTQILAEETKASSCDPHYRAGDILRLIFHKQPIPKLLLAGQVALRVCANHTRHGEAYFYRAAHVVSELNATNKTIEGKNVPSDASALRKIFLKYEPVMHFWAAAYHHYPLDDGRGISGVDVLNQMHISLEFLGAFLATAAQFEEILREAKSPQYVWSATAPASTIWDFDYFAKAKLGKETPETLAALKSYVSPPKT